MNKHKAELSYWEKQNTNNELNNSWYEYFYTNHFDINKQDFTNKKILDIGCGPQGSLEWISNDSCCYGLDPLANQYYNRFGCDKHKMTYIFAKSENIPFPDNYFDYIASFNSLDHVDNVEDTIKEIHRVLKTNGVFLLLVEINHEPTDCEPHTLNEQIITDIQNNTNLLCHKHNLYGMKYIDNGYKNIQEKIPPETTPRYLSAKFIKQ
jgi:ubiquinone/menaquinone biosynthesis C-methylase UbiE